MTSDSYSLIDTHIGYSYVTETTQYNSTGTPENAVSYTFSTGVDNASYYNNSVNMPQGSTNSSNQNLSASISGALSYNSKLSSIGHLLVKDYYVGNSIVQSHIFKYNAINNSFATQPAPTLPSLGATDTIVILSKRYVPVARKMFVYPPVLEQKTTTDFSNGGAFYTYKNIQYDSKLRIKKEIIENSDNMQYFTKYTYPDEIHTNTSTSPYYRLKQENRIKYPIETLMGYIQNHQEKITGGELNLYTNTSTHPTLYQTLSLQTTYAIDNYQTITPSGNTLTYDTRYRLKCEYVFDSSLRLKQITPIDRITTTLTWSGIYPITKTINNQTNSYTYSPYVGMTSMTDARGVKIGYGYDSYGRLVSEHMYTSSGQKNVINAYSYHIKDSDALSYRVDMSPLTATSSVLFNPSTMTSSSSKTLTTINYFDDFGRPSQIIARKQTPSGKDLVMMTGYTGLNRTSHQWLPIPANSAGLCISQSSYKSQATSFYSDNRPFQETIYEASELNRETGSVRPGNTYANYPSHKTYETNKNDNVHQYSVAYRDSSGHVVMELKRVANYENHLLYKNVVSDEDGVSTTIFTDKLGRKIMERTGGYDTYYVYDTKGQLCYVLPPLVSSQLSIGTYGNNNDVLKKYAYVYKYDERGNQIYKRLPGCEPIWMVYDVTNTLVMSQHGNQRKLGKYWTVYKYDNLRRLIYSAEIQTSNTSTYEGYLSSFRDWYMLETFSTGSQTYPLGNTGYSRGYFHNRPTQLLTVNYYDTYDFLTFVPSAKQSQMEFTSFSGNTSYANATGLLTGSRTYCLDGTGSYSETVYYYDYQGREIQRRTINHFGGYDVLSTKYDFADNITDTWAYQSTNDGLEISEEYHYTYDHANRPLITKYKYNNDPEIILQSYNYDELGRVRSRHIHGGIDSVAFSYNMQNQITRIKSSGYEQNYYYQESCPLGTGVYPKNNGLITATTWTYGNKINGYEYHYDNMNRLAST